MTIVYFAAVGGLLAGWALESLFAWMSRKNELEDRELS